MVSFGCTKPNIHNRVAKQVGCGTIQETLRVLNNELFGDDRVDLLRKH